ncbi:MAG: lactate racemase domain-containing protein [Myxococcota bacterium]|nr:lactate racemase domain-containing protein [Myxococcota bacterium]
MNTPKGKTNNSSHPCVVTIDHNSKPRVLFSGNQLVEVDLPVGTRVIYPKPPMEPLPDVDAAIRHAINHPEGGEPLYAKLKPGMKVTIALDDISLPLPQMQRPDVRQRILDIILPLLADHGVEDIHIIVATCLHRPMTESEIRRMVGNKVMSAFWPDRLYNHDAEKPGGLTELGRTEAGELVEISTRAATSDLLIYLNVNFVPMDGGHKSVAVGLCGYRSLRHHHNPETIRQSKTYMDPEDSELDTRVQRMGRLVDEHLDVFHVETSLNNRMFAPALDFLAKNEDELTPAEEIGLKALVKTLSLLPSKARQAIFEKVPAPYGVTGVFAGTTEAAHAPTLEKCYQQYLVPVEGQADILVTGVPYISPYNVGSFLNPLLVSVLIQGYLFNLFRGKPLVRKGGTVIAFHPCSDDFDRDQHLSYVEFFHKVLPKTRDAAEIHKTYENEFRQNPAYIQLYRSGTAYHPAHPFYMWYWGENGRQHIGRVIIVGADNEYVPEILGYETASTFAEALRMAKETSPPEPDISCLHICPVLMADVTDRPEPLRLVDGGAS